MTDTPRKLATIVALDVAGYSARTEADEARTTAEVAALRKVIEGIAARHGGRVFNTAGDGFMLEFGSSLAAVEAALELAETCEPKVRVGVHLGDVMVQANGDLLGHGVNVAARLMAQSSPGAALVSGAVRQTIRGPIAERLQSRGMLQLDKMAERIEAFALASAALLPNAAPPAPDPLEAAPSSAPVRPSIAVLRFANLGGDPEQQYFADGMVEDVLTGLSRIKGLSVIARNSSFACSSAAVDIRKTARELGARYVLEGSVRKSGDHVRVTAQLIEAESARSVWSARYDRKLAEIFALQDELAMSVVAAIEPNLRAAEIERVKRKRPDNLDAYDLLLRALPLIYSAMPDGATQGLPLIEKAIAKEPDYAQAHAFAAWGHEIMFMRGGGRDDDRVAAIRHAQAAIAHGRDDAIALGLGGFVMGMVAHDRVAARQAFEAALELSPSCALAYMLGSVVYALGGDATRAIAWGEEAIRLSPRDPMVYSPLLSITFGHITRGEDEAAFAAAQKTLHANPTWTSSHMLMAATQGRLGHAKGAASSAKRVIELQPDFTISGFCTAFGLAPSVATPLGEGLRLAGLDD